MIGKILKIKGLGKFKNFSNTGDDDLKFLKNTIIFGFNTYGKSTLTTIFRSLKNSEQKYLQGKKSFNHTGEIVVDILDGNSKHITLANGKWSNPNIVIFDNNFIHSAVFVGDEIDHKQKSSLHGVFVGENVGQKVTKLKGLRDEQDALEKKRDQIKAGYIKNNLGTFDAFLKTKEITNIDKEIEKKKEEIQRLRNIAALKQLISVSPLASTFADFATAMQKTLDTSAEKNMELTDMLRLTESDFELADVLDAIYEEEESDDMTKIIAMFDRGGDEGELSDILELITDAWNYFPHKALGELSPAEMITEHQKHAKNHK
jgi:hypothetical protein